MPILRITYSDAYNETEFETRAAIKSNKIQEFIKDARENNVDISCLCVSENNEYPRIISSHLPNNNNVFTLKRNSKYDHSEDCIFH
jgi:hypothetical protein